MAISGKRLEGMNGALHCLEFTGLGVIRDKTCTESGLRASQACVLVLRLGCKCAYGYPGILKYNKAPFRLGDHFLC